jgi:ATP synthase protein I
MRNSIAAGRRLAVRVVAVQLAVTILLAAGFALQGWQSGLAALSGGGVVVLGTAALALRLFVPGPATAKVVLRRLINGNLLKWGVILLGLYLALAKAQLPGMPVIVGLAVTVLVPHFFGLHDAGQRTKTT